MDYSLHPRSSNFYDVYELRDMNNNFHGTLRVEELCLAYFLPNQEPAPPISSNTKSAIFLKDVKDFCIVPWFSLTIVVLQIICFVFYLNDRECAPGFEGIPIESVFLYRIDKRMYIWRFFTYAFIHNSFLHLLFNSAILLIVGTFLEKHYGLLYVCVVYLNGVVSAALITSVLERPLVLIGSSAGIYAMLGAYFIYVLYNWGSLHGGLLQISIIITTVILEIFLAVCFKAEVCSFIGNGVSYTSHLTGCLIGCATTIVLSKCPEKFHRPRSLAIMRLIVVSLYLMVLYISFSMNVYELSVTVAKKK